MTENSPNALIKYYITKVDHYFWNFIYTKTHLSLSKNKIKHKLALLKQYEMPFWKRCLASSTDVIIIIVINDYALLTNIRSRWLYIGQALFCKDNTQLSSPNKLGWFAHLRSQSEHRICFILPARRFNHKITINMLY